MAKVKISVIVPVYNVEHYLKKCLESLVCQTFREYEILLINDGSTDGSRELCLEYEKQYEFVTLFEKENGGLSDARNYGVSKAKGEFVVFVDSDDYVEDDMLQAFWEGKEKTGADIVIGRHREVKAGAEENRERNGGAESRVLGSQEALEIMCYEKEFGTTACCKMFPVTYFKEISFPIGKWYEDLATVYKLIAQGKNIVFLDKVFYYYVQRTGSIRNNSWNEKVLEVMEAARQLLVFYEKMFPAIRQAAIQRYFFSANEVFVHAFWEKNYREIVAPIRKELHFYRKAMIENPKISRMQKCRYLMMIYLPGGYKSLWKILKQLKSGKGE